jgi:hypothetical protein
MRSLIRASWVSYARGRIRFVLDKKLQTLFALRPPAACTDMLVDLENVGSSYGNVFSTLTSGFLGGSSTVRNELV